jgi:hypothetical protein
LGEAEAGVEAIRLAAVAAEVLVVGTEVKMTRAAGEWVQLRAAVVAMKRHP